MSVDLPDQSRATIGESRDRRGQDRRRRAESGVDLAPEKFRPYLVVIIVVIILSIGSMILIDRLDQAAVMARNVAQEATLGTLRGAWAVAYLAKQSAPTAAQVVANVADLKCTGGAIATCVGITKNDGSGLATFKLAETAGVVASPTDISISAR